MMSENRVRVTVLMTAIAFLCACTPAAVPADNDPGSTPGAISPATDVISSNSVERIVLLHTLSGHSKRVLDVAFSARAELVASSSQDMEIKVWDARSGREVHSFPMECVDMADIDISTDGNLLASGEAIWDLDSMQEIRALERGSRIPTFVAFSPDGSSLALSRLDQATSIVDVTTGQPVYAFSEQDEQRTKVIEFSPDGALLAVGVIDGTVRLWDVGSGELAGILHYAGETDIHDIAFSPDGRYLASAGRVPAVTLWDVASGEAVRTFRVQDTVLSVAFSPDGTVLAAAAGAEKAILLWDVESGDLLRSLPHEDQSMSIAFSPDGRLLAAGCFDSQVYLWGMPANR